MSVFTVLGIIALIIGVILFFVARNQKSKLSDMSATDTYTAQLLADVHKRIVGSLGADALRERCEVSGTIECDEPLQGPISNSPVAIYTYNLIREYEEEVTESSTEDTSRTSTRRTGHGYEEERTTSSREGSRQTSIRRGSETVQSDDQRVRFWVRDSTGRTLVDPTSATLDMQQTGERYQKEEQPDRQARRRTLGHRSTERALAVGDQVYVLGWAVDFQGAPMLARNPGGQEGRFFISWKTERELSTAAESGAQKLNTAAMVLGGLGVLLVLVGFIA